MNMDEPVASDPLKEGNMIERVARAIHNREYEGELAPAGTAEHALFLEVARAAIIVVHDELSKLIVTGHLQGNGCDKQAERNGIIRACNHLFYKMGEHHGRFLQASETSGSP